MSQKLFKQTWIACALLLGASSQLFAEKHPPETNMLDAPEMEIAAILNDLDALSLQMTGTHQVQTRPGLAPHALAASKAFERARAYFKDKEYLSAISEVNNFRNLKQVPTSDEHLEATLIQAKSYDASRLHRHAIRTYMQYISAAVTSPKRNYSEVLNVLRRLIPLAAKEATSSSADIGPLLSSLTSIEFPEEKRAELTYLAARTAGASSRGDIADTWFQESQAAANDVNLKARSLYFQGLLAIGRKDFVDAEQHLQEALRLEGQGADEFKNFARLALARIAQHLRKPERALSFYNEISDDAINFKDATFESTYVLLQLGDRQGAIDRARLYMKRHPKDRQALQIKNLLGYLELNAGDLASARQQIEDADQQFADFHMWVQKAFDGSTPITQLTIDEAIARGEILQQPPELVLTAQTQFRRIAEQTRHLADTRGDLQQLVFTLGRTDLKQLNPMLYERGDQLMNFVEKVLTLGHRLSATERYLYAKRLNPLQSHELKNSELQRTKLLSTAADMRRQRYLWAHWFNLAGLNNELAKQNSELAETSASMAALKYLLSNQADTQTDASELSQQQQSLHQRMNKSLLNLRSARIRAINLLNSHQLNKALLTQYASALHDEAEILAKVRDEQETAGNRFLAEDAAKAWVRWQRTTEDVYKQFELLENDINKHTVGLLRDIDARLQQADTLLANLTSYRLELEKMLRTAAPLLLSQYEQDIARQRSRHLKWQADIDRLRSDQAKNDRSSGDEKLELEQQMLQYNLQSLESGNTVP